MLCTSSTPLQIGIGMQACDMRGGAFAYGQWWKLVLLHKASFDEAVEVYDSLVQKDFFLLTNEPLAFLLPNCRVGWSGLLGRSNPSTLRSLYKLIKYSLTRASGQHKEHVLHTDYASTHKYCPCSIWSTDQIGLLDCSLLLLHYGKVAGIDIKDYLRLEDERPLIRDDMD